MNEEHTPTTDEVRLNYSYLGGTAREREFDRRAETFDRWYAAEFGRIIAAAEQRGAERVEQAIRERHVPNDDGVCRACLLRFAPCPSLADAQKIVRSYRADQEGDND